jgi:hypothetical protein
MKDPRVKVAALFNSGDFDGSGDLPNTKFKGTLAIFNGGPNDIATPLV